MLSMIWKPRKQTCTICKGTEGKVLVVRRTSTYPPLVWSYHQKCLNKIVCNPEEHPEWVRYAYGLTKVIEEQDARKQREIAALKRLKPKYGCKEKLPGPSI